MKSTASSYFIPSSISASATITGARPRPATQCTATQESGFSRNLFFSNSNHSSTTCNSPLNSIKYHFKAMLIQTAESNHTHTFKISKINLQITFNFTISIIKYNFNMNMNFISTYRVQPRFISGTSQVQVQ